jgi:hypothetical protein
MAAIYDGVSSLLRTLPAGLLGVAQDGEPTQSEPPSQAHHHFLIPAELEAHKCHMPRRPPAAVSAPLRSSCPAASKRVSWADEHKPVRPESLKPCSPVRRTDGEHPLRRRLLGVAAAEQTALAHVARARAVKASASSPTLPQAPEWQRAFGKVGTGDLVVF